MKTRRGFAKIGCAALVGMTAKADRRVAGSFVNESFATGHTIRDRVPLAGSVRTVRVPVVIVGGGIAGLTAAWRLYKRGFPDFVLLEMNSEAGGNARSGQNEVSAFPWAAHYVPVPGPKAAYVRELFEELGVLEAGRWNERFLCFSPQERLFRYGEWQEGIEPSVALNRRERDQYQRLGEEFANHRASGAFTIPMELGLNSKASSLDKISFAEWLQQRRIDSPTVLWYMNYACRDDYGALTAETSAWAGIHYFASRSDEAKGPLTWPEGNGWITKQLLQRVGSFVKTGQVVRRIEEQGKLFRVRTNDTLFVADVVVFAAPSFLAPYLISGFGRLTAFQYSPWLTANLTIERPPRGAGPLERAWDNVVFDSPTLGYVDATHQTLRTHVDRTVWDILLGARARAGAGKSCDAAAKGLELLERCDPERLGACASRHPQLHLKHRHHANGTCDGQTSSGLDFR